MDRPKAQLARSLLADVEEIQPPPKKQAVEPPPKAETDGSGQPAATALPAPQEKPGPPSVKPLEASSSQMEVWAGSQKDDAEDASTCATSATAEFDSVPKVDVD